MIGRRRRRADRAYLESLRGRILLGACADCIATAAVTMDDDGVWRLYVYHCATCPAAAGVVSWCAAALEGR